MSGSYKRPLNIKKGILDPGLFNDDELRDSVRNYALMIDIFNSMYERDPGSIEEKGFEDFMSEPRGRQVDASSWLEFLSDHRVSQVLNKVMVLKMRNQVNKLLSNDSKSTAEAQKLNAALGFLERNEERILSNDTTVYVYTSVPLSKDEEYARNAKTQVIRPLINPHNPANPSSKNYRERLVSRGLKE